MIVGPLPVADPGDLGAASPPPIMIEAPTQPIGSPLAINWSLAVTTPQDGSASGRETDQQSDPASGAEPEIVVEADIGPTDIDPVGAVNETSFRITQDIDAAVVGPVAYAYRDGLPSPLRQGLGNVVRNLGEPVNFLNFLLQFKIGDAAETLVRFAINSTVGLGGLIDLAEKPGIGLPYRRNGFANTMGFYGIEPGAYLYLPITGATTVRDLIGNSLDQTVLPTVVGAPFDQPEYAVSYFVISSLDSRVEIDQELERIGETIDPYATRRDTYLYRRARDIALLRGEEPPPPPDILREIEGDFDPLEEDAPQSEESDAVTDLVPAQPVAVTRPSPR